MKICNYSACEGIGGSGVAAKPPHHSPHPSAAGLPEQLRKFLALAENPVHELVDGLVDQIICQGQFIA